MSKKIGYIEAIDELFLRSIEDPLLFNLLKKNYHFEIRHSERIPTEGPGIIVSNFQSVLDPLIGGVTLMECTKTIPQHLLPLNMGLENTLMNLIRMNQAIFLQNGELDERAMTQCLDILNQNKFIIVYPELSPNPGNGKMLPFHPDFVRLAFESKSTIIPMAIFGSDRVYGVKSKYPSFKGSIKVSFGKPFEYDKIFKKNQSLDFRILEKLTTKVKRRINNLWSDMWASEEEKKRTN